MATESTLPPLYAPWLRAIAGGAIPGESKATCDNCAMLPAPGTPVDAVYFQPSVKCCAYQPRLVNFLAGRILSGDDPALAEGRKALELRIARRVAVTPAAAGPGGVFGLLYRGVPNAFGRAPALKCDFLAANGGCGVWKHRPGVCATWYCKHVRGEKGFVFWKLADKLLREAEHDLAMWCMAELRAGAAEVGEASEGVRPHVSELDGEIDWPRYRRLWGEWAGREAEFYRECAWLVDPLGWERVLEIAGPKVRILAGLLRDAYENMSSHAIPERLRLAEFQLHGAEGNGYRVTTYSSYDPLLMPETLARTLRYFDGRPTEKALEDILTEQGVRIDPSLVRKMVDFGVLRSAETPQGELKILD